MTKLFLALSVLLLGAFFAPSVLGVSVSQSIAFRIGGGGGTCPQGSSFPDGCASALAAGSPQWPNLLNGSVVGITTRPAWNVAGVDYAVGVPTSQTSFTDWRTINGSFGGAVWDNSAGYLRCQSGSAVLNGIDFTATNGTGDFGSIYVPSDGCASVTVTNSKIGCVSGGGNKGYFLQDQNGIALTLKSNTVDFSACGSPGANCQTGGGWPAFSLIVQGGSSDIEYNVLRHYCDHTLEMGQMSSLTFKYNLLDDPNNGVGSSAHMNYSQFGHNTGPTTIAYNTIYLYQSPTSGNEGFQLYSNELVSQATPMTLSNNVAVDTSGEMCVGYHGTTSSDFPTHLTGSGPALNQNNYFAFSADAIAHCNATQGIFAYYYPGSFGTLSPDTVGWTNTGNIDMVTGSTISP